MSFEPYESCPGTGQQVARVTSASPSVGPGRPGGDGEGECSVCGRVISQRSGVAKRHKDKRDSPLDEGEGTHGD